MSAMSKSLSWIVVAFEGNYIQHVPSNWYKSISSNDLCEKGECWFPFTKKENPNSKVTFKSDQINKMILDCYLPNITDGTWFSASKIAGPLDKEIIARNVARAYSGSEDSEDYVQNPDFASRSRKPTKRYSPEPAASTLTSKEKNSKKKTNNQQSSKYILLPEPPICPMETLKDPKNVSKMPTSVIEEHCSNVSEKPINKNFPLTEYIQQSSSNSYVSEPEETSLTEISDIWQSIYNEVDDIHTNAIEYNTTLETPSCPVQVPSNYHQECFESQKVDQLLDNNIHSEQNITHSSSPTKIINEVSKTQNNITGEVISKYSQDSLDNSLNMSGAVSTNDNFMQKNDCCCSSIRNLKKTIQSKLEPILGQVLMLNATQAKMCTYLETLDKKVNMVLEADKRLRALAFPQPKLSAAFIDLLPISTMEDLSEVERLLHPDFNDFMKNKEDLKSFLLFKIGNKHLNSAIRTAMSFVMTRSIAANFSFKGKTKLKFSDLNIFKIISDTLSGYIKTPEDEVSFTDVVQNWLKHAPLQKTKCNTANTTTNEENTVQKNHLSNKI